MRAHYLPCRPLGHPVAAHAPCLPCRVDSSLRYLELYSDVMERGPWNSGGGLGLREMQTHSLPGHGPRTLGQGQVGVGRRRDGAPLPGTAHIACVLPLRRAPVLLLQEQGHGLGLQPRYGLWPMLLGVEVHLLDLARGKEQWLALPGSPAPCQEPQFLCRLPHPGPTCPGPPCLLFTSISPQSPHSVLPLLSPPKGEQCPLHGPWVLSPAAEEKRRYWNQLDGAMSGCPLCWPQWWPEVATVMAEMRMVMTMMVWHPGGDRCG